MDKVYIVMKKIPCDVFQKHKSSQKYFKSYLDTSSLLKAQINQLKIYVTFLVTFFPF